MSLNKNSFLTGLLFCLVQTGFTQDHPTDSIALRELNEVVVTATRTKRQLSDLTTPTTLITKEEIQRINALRLSDLLEEHTGLITVPDFGGGIGIQLQGLDSQYILLLIDGQPLIGRQAGTFDLNRLSVLGIEQIEIVKGASSSLYGNEALGGVVNIITKKPEKSFEGKVSTRYGSLESSDLGALLSMKTNNIGLSLSSNRNQSEGYSLSEASEIATVQPFSNTTVNARLSIENLKKHDLTISQRWYNEQQENRISEEINGNSAITEINTTLGIESQWKERFSSTAEFYSSRYLAEENYFLDQNFELFDQNHFDQRFIRPELRAVLSSKDQNEEWVFGSGITLERLERDNFSEDPEFRAPYAFIQFEKRWSNRILMLLGARYDQHNVYASQLSPKASLRYKLSESVILKSSYGYGFKAPDFRQLYFDFSNSTVGYTLLGFNAVQRRISELEQNGEIASTMVNPSFFSGELAPESSASFNLELSYKHSRFSSSINFFQNELVNLIDTQVIARKRNGQNVFSYYNVASVFTRGLEWNSHTKISAQIGMKMGAQYLLAKSREAQAAFSNREVFVRDPSTQATIRLTEDDYFGLPNRSRFLANLKLDYRNKKEDFDANLRLVYRSKFGLFDTNGNQYLDHYDQFVSGFAVVDVALNKQLRNGFRLSLGCDNILNYTDPPLVTNLAGRLFYSQVTFNF